MRLCDGRFFPLSPTAANVTPAKLCSALCPASRTKVFEGAGIEEATAADGARYAGLPTAFLFRKELKKRSLAALDGRSVQAARRGSD